MDGKGSRRTTVLAAGCFIAAIAIAVVALLLGAGLVREYGPQEGYGNLILQTLPIVAVGVGGAWLLTWAGVRLRRRGNETG